MLSGGFCEQPPTDRSLCAIVLVMLLHEEFHPEFALRNESNTDRANMMARRNSNEDSRKNGGLLPKRFNRREAE